MELTYKQLEAALIGHFRIHPEGADTFRSRIKQLQRLGFPAGVNIGRGEKMAYSADHLLQMVTAFELIGGTQIPAKSATDLVTRHWRSFAVGYAITFTRRRPGGERIFAWIVSKAFGNLQIESDKRDNLFTVAGASSLIVAGEASFIGIFTGLNPRRRSHVYPVFCLTDLLRSVARGAEAAGVVDFWRDSEIAEWLPGREEAEGMFRTWLLFDPWANENPPLTGADIIEAHAPDEQISLFEDSGEEEERSEADAKMDALAAKLLPLLPKSIVDAISGRTEDKVEITEEDIKEMMFLGLLEAGEDMMFFTPLGLAIQRQLKQETMAETYARNLLEKTAAKRAAREKIAAGTDSRRLEALELLIAAREKEPTHGNNH